MSRMTNEIRQYMSDLTETAGGNLTARFLFPSDFIGFQGHFPGNPVLPGICKIQAVLVILQERYKKTTIRLKEIVQAKFLSPVSCGEELAFECRETKRSDREMFVKALISSNDKKIAELKLRLRN
ncbi:hypothetical protein QUF80_23290 [Desulfococcaceae bacterium HSG8]|nr:hypothetical protein [Desulfococcaceae bacterium HSG8]